MSHHFSQSKQPRRDGDGTACPQLENWDGESHSVYPSARIYRNIKLPKIPNMRVFRESRKENSIRVITPMNPRKSCAFHLMQKAMWYEYYSSNTNLKPTWIFFGWKPRWFNQETVDLLISVSKPRYLCKLPVSHKPGDSNGYSKIKQTYPNLRQSQKLIRPSQSDSARQPHPRRRSGH
jgi:hypothetical protein